MTRLGEPGFEVVRATGVCAVTGQAIATGEEYIAALFESEDGTSLERRDYSLDAWRAGTRPGPASRMFGAWKAVMPAPNESRRTLVDDESLMDLLEQLGEATEPARISFRYVLALLLLRRKVLKYEGTRRDRPDSPKGLVMLVRRATRVDEPPAPLIEVIDPGMDEQAIADAIEQIGSVLAPAGGGAGEGGSAGGNGGSGGKGG
ncbi:MAG: hypothetical protein KF678_09430 [Phycisphaeraceae bacterium]|nr:hypothetical protein [Phycisphaeraceae bacterium]